MLTTLQSSFRLIANAVYNAYTGQRRAEAFEPRTLFLQGVAFDAGELQKSFRFVGVRPPEVSPPSVQRTIFVDEGFEPYKAVFAGKVAEKEAENGREKHWTKVILDNLDGSGKNLLRVGLNHVEPPMGLLQMLSRNKGGSLPKLLRKNGVELRIVDRVADVNEVFGK
jgi:hypothetical protein